MLASNIIKEVNARVEANKASVMPVSFPQEDFTKPTNGAPFAEMHIKPNETVDAWCGDSKTGNILFNCNFVAGYTLQSAVEEAEKFLSIFTEGLIFNGVKVVDIPDIRGDYKDKRNNGRFYIPVIVKYEAK